MVNWFKRFTQTGPSEDTKEHRNIRKYLRSYGEKLLRKQQEFAVLLDTIQTNLEEGASPQSQMDLKEINNTISVINQSFSAINRGVTSTIGKTDDRTRLHKELQDISKQLQQLAPLRTISEERITNHRLAQQQVTLLKRGITVRTQLLETLLRDLDGVSQS